MQRQILDHLQLKSVSPDAVPSFDANVHHQVSDDDVLADPYHEPIDPKMSNNEQQVIKSKPSDSKSPPPSKSLTDQSPKSFFYSSKSQFYSAVRLTDGVGRTNILPSDAKTEKKLNVYFPKSRWNNVNHKNEASRLPNIVK